MNRYDIHMLVIDISNIFKHKQLPNDKITILPQKKTNTNTLNPPK